MDDPQQESSSADVTTYPGGRSHSALKPQTTERNVSLLRVFGLLLNTYGPQHWWPADDPFEVMVGAILTQSTSWTNVTKAIGRLKSAGLLSPQAIRRVESKTLEDLIRPSGFFRAKARKLKAMAKWLDSRDDNLPEIFAQSTVKLRNSLLGVFGIGEETADSILLYAAGKPVFVIDAYTRRIFERLRIISPSRNYTEWRGLFEKNLPPDATLFNEYHALIVQHGKAACKKTPRCAGCCLRSMCTTDRPFEVTHGHLSKPRATI